MRTKITNLMMGMAALLAIACKKDSGPQTPPAAAVPGKATLTFPLQNSACVTGAVLSNTQSSVTFTWNASGNTDSYEVNIKDLLAGTVIKQTANTAQLTVTLSRNTPYSWFIVSKTSLSTATAQSDTWKFYNSGLGATSHPPFPAEAVSPVLGQSLAAATTANLSWKGSDADNDIAGYDVYFGTGANPPLSKANVTDAFLNGVTIASGNTYYWKIVSKDLQGNTSDSDVFQFVVR